jgi:polar amino acid transport system substrate-binding protein
MKFILFFYLFIGLTYSSEYYVGNHLIISTHYSPPWSYGDCTGAEIEIIRAAFKKEEIELTCETTSYARLVKNFTSKKTLFASPVVKLEGQKVGAYYSDPFIKYVDVGVSFSKGNISLNNLFNKIILSYQKASTYLGKGFKEVVEKSKSYKELPDRDSQIKMLNAKRVDYVVGEQNILHTLSKSLYPKSTLYTNIVLKKWDVRAGSHNKDLMQRFNRGLRKVRSEGLIKKIYKKYKIIDH